MLRGAIVSGEERRAEEVSNAGRCNRGAKVNPVLAKLPDYQSAAITDQMQLEWATIAGNSAQWLQDWNSRVKRNLR